MNKKSGYCEVKHPETGAIIPLKFSMNTFLLFCEMRQIDLAGIDKALGENSPVVLRDMAFCAMVTAARISGVEQPLPSSEAIGELIFDYEDSVSVINTITEAILSARVFGKTLSESPAPKKKANR